MGREKGCEMFQIALDGPPGSGKSTLGKALAEKLNILYLDSGAVYRAYALHLLKAKIDLDDSSAVEAEIARFDFHFEGRRAILSGEDVTEAIRTEEVSETIRFIGANPRIRGYLTSFMQKLAEGRSVVMDGRDVASTILPKAQFKYYVVCSIEERARRRYEEMRARGESISLEEMRAAIAERERIEKTREVAPLKRHPDSKLIDSSDKSIEDLLNLVESDIRESGIE